MVYLKSSGYYRFRPNTGQDLVQLVARCRDLQQNPNSTFQLLTSFSLTKDNHRIFLVGLQPLQSQLTERYGRENCPDNPAAIITECGDNVPCMYDYVMFNSKVLGTAMQNTWNAFEVDRFDMMRQCNEL